MDTNASNLTIVKSDKRNSLSLPVNIFLLVVRSLTTIMRTPEALLPPVAISIFFLVIYQSTLGKASSFIPGIGGSYLGFISLLSAGHYPDQALQPRTWCGISSAVILISCY
jgi:hypothetical protein